MNQNSGVGMKISTDITTKKVRRQRRLLLELASNRTAPPPEIGDAVSAIAEVLVKINSKACLTKESLLGLEGWAAKRYFEAVSATLPKKWKFAERSQHPATDAFNAVLNYMYGIAYSDVERIIILSGLDPNAGFYHADSYGKPTLSYDLIELSRPMVDKSAIVLFTKRIARDSWFETQDEGAVFLGKNGRTSTIAKYAEVNKARVEQETWNYCRKITKMYKEAV